MTTSEKVFDQLVTNLIAMEDARQQALEYQTAAIAAATADWEESDECWEESYC